MVFPGAGYAELALAAAAQTFGQGKGVALEGLKIEAPLVLDGKSRTGLQLSLLRRSAVRDPCAGGIQGRNAVEPPRQGRLARAEPSPSAVSLAESWSACRASATRPRSIGVSTHWVCSMDPSSRISKRSGSDRTRRWGGSRRRQKSNPTWPATSCTPPSSTPSFQLLAALPGEGTFLPVSIDRLDVHEPGKTDCVGICPHHEHG